MIFFRCPPRGNISREEPWAGSAPGGEGAGEERREMNPVLGIQILSPQHSAQSFILITFWHHIITRHITSHHRKHRRENGPPCQDTEKENDIHWTMRIISRSISGMIFIEHLASLTSAIKHCLKINYFALKSLLATSQQAAAATRLIHSVYFGKKLQVCLSCERRTHVQSWKSTTL